MHKKKILNANWFKMLKKKITFFHCYATQCVFVKCTAKSKLEIVSLVLHALS